MNREPFRTRQKRLSPVRLRARPVRLRGSALPRRSAQGDIKGRRTPLFRRLCRQLPPRGKPRIGTRAPRRAGWRQTLHRSNNTQKRKNHTFFFFPLQRKAACGKSEAAARLSIESPQMRGGERKPDAERCEAYANVGLSLKSRRSAGSSLPRNA